MKKTISLFLSMFLFAIICNAQSDVQTSSGGVLARAEVMPSFKGGEDAMHRYLSENLKYPEKAKESGSEGMVYVQFIVDAQGNVIKPAVIRGVSADLDAEALRVVSGMPQWIPGKQDGKEVSVTFTLPVSFKL